MEKNQENKVGLDIIGDNTLNQDSDSTENPDKLVLFPTEDDGLLKMYKKLQADNKKRKNNRSDEPFN